MAEPRHVVGVNIEALNYWLTANPDRLHYLDMTDLRRYGTDFVTMLGIFGSPKARDILTNMSNVVVETEIETDPRRGGAFYPNTGVISLTPSIGLSGQAWMASNFAHESMHRAFAIMSMIPSLKDMLPAELNTTYKGGWGRIKSGVWSLTDQVNPEHCMIYIATGGVKRRPANSTEASYIKQFFNHTMLWKGTWEETYDYWAEMYRQVNVACQVFLQSTVGSRPTGNRGRGVRKSSVGRYELDFNNELQQNFPKAFERKVSRTQPVPRFGREEKLIVGGILTYATAVALILGGRYAWRRWIKPLFKNKAEQELQNPETIAKVNRYLRDNAREVRMAKRDRDAAMSVARDLQSYVNAN